ncbi:major facilitator superfamily domain-containing protein [Cladorrhinum samala]|uniref:Major facilitator superfamily domain-containing protein n=1 Tax=Cladorrhinum samala TaxID=585594 RepID=A0AAV9HWF3_9PEZI|nr:major facilitator superfamily domain-containing protein [Cladorrhinum samala]
MASDSNPRLDQNDNHDDDYHHVPLSRPGRFSSNRALVSLLSLVLLVNLSMSLYQLPLNRVIERRLCRDFYTATDPSVLGPDGEVREDLCKIDKIQQELAWIQGAMETAWIVGDFVMAIPLGFVAERYGRRTVLALNLMPRLCMLAWAVAVGYFENSLPTKALLASPMLSILGGDCVFNSIVYALASDLTEDRVLRASYFAYMSSTSYVVALVGPALASATMTLLLWLPFYLGIALLATSSWAIRSLPPDQALSSATGNFSDSSTQPLLSSPVLKALDARQTPSMDAITRRFALMKGILLSRPLNFALLLFSMFLTSLASADTKLLVQYISKRYGWTFASAGYLLSGKAVVNFVLLTIIIPRLLAWRASRRRERDAQDTIYLTYTKACIAISVVGAIAIALADAIYLLVPSLFLYALGSALPIFTFSLLKSSAVSPPTDTTSAGRIHEGPGLAEETQVFSIVMLVKTLGSLVGAPLMAACWIRGIAVGGGGLGLPYLVSAGCYAIAVFVVSRMRIDY